MKNLLFKSLLDNYDDGIAIIDKDNQVVYENKIVKTIKKECESIFNINLLRNNELIKFNQKHFRLNIKKIDFNKILIFKDVTSEVYTSKIIDAYKFIIDQTNDGIIITNDNGLIIDYNKASEDFEGLEKNYVIGKSPTEVYNISEQQSDILKVVKTRKSILDVSGKFQTVKGKEVILTRNYYPIIVHDAFYGVCVITINNTRIRNLLDRTLELQSKIKKNEIIIRSKYTFNDIIGNSHAMLKVIELAKKASDSNGSVLIIGDTGTGKEMFVQSIHDFSKTKTQPFVPVNCAAIPETLMESILFGTVKGSYTGAENKEGLIEQAGNGTLYLDELNSMPINLQAKLLRVIQERNIRPIGSNDLININCRFIASVNEDPQFCIQKNLLRRDLFYRLAVITIPIPSLKERIEDLEVLSNYFINIYNSKYGGKVKKISGNLMEVFRNYSWPGNVRELQHIIECAINLDKNSEEIKLEHLPNYLHQLFYENKYNYIPKIESYDNHLNNLLHLTEKEIITKRLQIHNYNVTKSAKSLGLSRQNLHYRIRKLKIKNE